MRWIWISIVPGTGSWQEQATKEEVAVSANIVKEPGAMRSMHGMSTRLERVVRRAVRSEFRNHKLKTDSEAAAAKPMEVGTASIALLEKTFVTNETFYKEVGAIPTDIGVVRTEMAGLGTELRGEIADLGTKLRTEMADLGTELRAEIAGLGTELRAEISALGTELRAEISELRTEIGGLRIDMHTESGALRAEMAKIPFETIKWFFTFSGIVAAIVFGALRLI
jgi:hypothetical protein